MLEDCRILVACEGRAGRMAGSFLAELGADVARLEWVRTDRAATGYVVDRSTCSVAVPPGTAGRDLVRDLLGHVEVVICDFNAVRRHESGLEEASIRAVNPGVVLATITPYGQAGAFSAFPYDSQVAAALSGHVGSQWAYREGGVYSLPDFGSHVAGTMTVSAVLAALYGKACDGGTRTMRTSLLAGWLATRNVHAVTGQNATRVSVRDPQGGMTPVMRMYRAGDGDWLMLSCSTDQFWGKLCIALGVPELTGDPRFDLAPFAIPPEHKAALVEILEDRFASGSRDEWIATLRAGDVPCAPVFSPTAALRDLQVEVNGGVIDLEIPGLGTTRQVAPLVRFDDVDIRVRHVPHDFGADGDAVRKRWTVRDSPDSSGGVTHALPLAGVRVLEICDWVAGPATGNTLRQLGAEVWKVESLYGDPARNLEYVYVPMNGAKPVLRVDLRQPEGAEILAKLIRRADVLVQNHRPQRARELGFDAVSARALNPKLVCHEIFSFGPTGPLSGDPAFDQLVAARTGLAWLQGGMSSGNPPVLHNGSVGDLPAAQLAVAAICAGLLWRHKTGTGTRSWTTLLEAGYLLNWSDAILYDGCPRQAEGGVDFLGPNPTRRLYRTRDDWVLLAVDDALGWTAFAQLLESELGPYERAVALPNDDTLANQIEAKLRERTSAEWEAGALNMCVPLVAPRYDSTVSTEPHIQENNYEARGTTDSGWEFSCPGYLIQVDGQNREGVILPPDPARGGRVILSAIGYSDEEIRALAARGVVVAATEPATDGIRS